jgi:Zinc finger, C2H2 type
VAESCPDCGVSLGSPAELVAHVKTVHGGVNPEETLAMNPESLRRGLVCALCGLRFPNREAIARHNLSPHYRTNSSIRRSPAYLSS